MKLKTKKNYKNKVPLMIIAAVVVVLLACAAAFAIYNSNQTSIKPGQQGVNLERSDAEKAAEEALKDDPGQKLENEQNDTPPAPSSTAPSGKMAVNVVLNYADIDNGTETSTVVAAGSVTNVTEENGVCTYSFTNNGSVITKTSSTLVNPTSTTCSKVSFPASELPRSGVWVVTLKYSSDKSEGTSNEQRITK